MVLVKVAEDLVGLEKEVRGLAARVKGELVGTDWVGLKPLVWETRAGDSGAAGSAEGAVRPVQHHHTRQSAAAATAGGSLGLLCPSCW